MVKVMSVAIDGALAQRLQVGLRVGGLLGGSSCRNTTSAAARSLPACDSGKPVTQSSWSSPPSSASARAGSVLRPGASRTASPVTGRPWATGDSGPLRAGQRRAGEVGEPGRGAPGVDVDGQPDVAGELDGGGVGVDDRAGLLVDDQDGHRDVGEHAGQDRVRRRGAGRAGDGSARGA